MIHARPCPSGKGVSNYLFVYGTLRRAMPGGMHHLLAPHAEYVADGVMRGVLYDLGDYPGVIESTATHDRVLGEVYRLPDAAAVLPLLDAYEGCTPQQPQPHEYVRKRCTIMMRGEPVQAWVYITNHACTGLKRIADGDYIRYIRQKLTAPQSRDGGADL